MTSLPMASPSRRVMISLVASSRIFVERRSASGCHAVRRTVISGRPRRSRLPAGFGWVFDSVRTGLGLELAVGVGVGDDAGDDDDRAEEASALAAETSGVTRTSRVGIGRRLGGELARTTSRGVLSDASIEGVSLTTRVAGAGEVARREISSFASDSLRWGPRAIDSCEATVAGVDTTCEADACAVPLDSNFDPEVDSTGIGMRRGAATIDAGVSTWTADATATAVTSVEGSSGSFAKSEFAWIFGWATTASKGAAATTLGRVESESTRGQS